MSDHARAPNSMYAWPRGVIALAISLLVCAAIWAFWPLTLQPRESLALLDTPAPQQQESAKFDLSAFRTPLWISPPPPPPPAPPPPTPPPLKLQLLAILPTIEGAPNALVFDPDQDAIITLSVGDSVGPGVVQSITSISISIRDSFGSRTLELGKPVQPAGSSPSRGGDQ